MSRIGLGSICRFRNEIGLIDPNTYISTESMLPNKAGLTKPSSAPETSKARMFHKGDTLISNIRPYFKKIWQAEHDGCCSADVLVFQPTSCDADYLFWLLSSDEFFNYVVTTSKGTKMPRGDKAAIMRFEFKRMTAENQKRIAKTLNPIRRLMRINQSANDYLEQCCQALFNNIQNDCTNEVTQLSDVAAVNPKRCLSRGSFSRCVEMTNLSTSRSFPNDWSRKAYNGGMKFMNGDTILARITPCLENGKAAYVNFLDEEEVAFGSTEYIVLSSKGLLPAEFFYFLARSRAFVNYATSHMNGSSGRQRVSAGDIEAYRLRAPSSDQAARFADFVQPAMREILTRSLENRHLASLRDALLPRLMSGIIDVSRVELPTLPNNHLPVG